jgi:hypothetical protein
VLWCSGGEIWCLGGTCLGNLYRHGVDCFGGDLLAETYPPK